MTNSSADFGLLLTFGVQDIEEFLLDGTLLSIYNGILTRVYRSLRYVPNARDPRFQLAPLFVC